MISEILWYAQVIQQQKMPKELLQSSLRPILVNLAHYKNLTMPLLQGLARLLELLSNWFNVTLGEKLMEHLKKWLEPEKLSQSQKSWKAGEEPKIAGGTFFNVFLEALSFRLLASKQTTTFVFALFLCSL
jgi:hypothetical protein